METSVKNYDSLRESISTSYQVRRFTDFTVSEDDDDTFWNCGGVNCPSPPFNLLETTSQVPLLYPLHATEEPSPTGFLLESNGYEGVINGFLMPFLAFITLIINSLVVVVLLRPHMRTPTNTLLVALAASDTLTSISPVPIWIRFYAGGTRPDEDWVPFKWCFTYYLLTDYMPSMFHTASVWLTTAVAGQRYLRVCRPPNSLARRLVCSMAGARRISAIVFAVAVASHLFRLAEMTYHPIDLPSRRLSNENTVTHDNSTIATIVTSPSKSVTDDVFILDDLLGDRTLVSGCRVELSRFVNDHEDAYFSTYFWTRVLFVHLIPCVLLIIFNLRLVKTMRDTARRRRLRRQPRFTTASENMTDAVAEAGLTNEVAPITAIRLLDIDKRNSVAPGQSAPCLAVQPSLVVDGSSTAMAKSSVTSPCRPRIAGHAGHGPGSTRATVMLMTVVGVFLVVEIPLVIIFVMVIIENTVGVDLYSDDTRHTAPLFINLFITVSYSTNFFVYCSMSREFRRTFAAMFVRHS